MKPLALACICVKSDVITNRYCIEKKHHENKEWHQLIGGINYYMNSARPIWNAAIEGDAGEMSYIAAVIEDHELYVRTRNGRFDLHWIDPFGGDDEEQVGEDKIVAPLPGTVVALLAEVGAHLEKGAPILTLEVMKMEQTLRAPFAGVLKVIKCKVGDIVQEGVELAEVEPAAG